MNIKEGVLYVFHTKNCRVCKIIDNYINDFKEGNILEVEHLLIPDDEVAMEFVESSGFETAMPILLYEKNDKYETICGLHTEEEVKTFLTKGFK